MFIIRSRNVRYVCYSPKNRNEFDLSDVYITPKFPYIIFVKNIPFYERLESSGLIFYKVNGNFIKGATTIKRNLIWEFLTRDGRLLITKAYSDKVIGSDDYLLIPLKDYIS